MVRMRGKSQLHHFFLKFTSAWTWEYGCDFDCAPWFKYLFVWTGTSITDWIVKPWVNNYPSKMWNSVLHVENDIIQRDEK